MIEQYSFDAVIIGAGAAGLMAAITAAKVGAKVAILERNVKIGAKILISGGGRCNFINKNAKSEHFISQNPHFTKSIFSRYSPQDFINLVEKHKVEYYEKKLGQLFCKKNSSEIIRIFEREMAESDVQQFLKCEIHSVNKVDDEFKIASNLGTFSTPKLVVATGGLSFPNRGATDFGYNIARQFGLKIEELTPGLVPFTLNNQIMKDLEGLSGISFDSICENSKASFRENVLITHRGLSGPAILQISNYWNAKESFKINMLPEINVRQLIEQNRGKRVLLKNLLAEYFSQRFSDFIASYLGADRFLGELSNKSIENIISMLESWEIKPSGDEGYIKAEVTRGGISTNELNQKTLESKKVQGLYFIGELVDVTGWLGGYNFYWAWASGYVCGEALAVG